MGIVHFFINLLKDPRSAIASWIAMGLGPTYAFIFLIIFIETGVVFLPFLPGDSLLFAAGVFAHDPNSGLKLSVLLPVVWCAPIIGDECNYFIGHFFGKRILESGKAKAMTPERIAKTERMIDKWGPLAVFLGRFFPFIRTFMPFISGFSGMKWHRFAPFSVLGGLVWSSLFTLLGYFFGGVPAVQQHFELVIVLILLISLSPTVIGLWKAKFGKKKKAAKAAEAESTESAEQAEPTESAEQVAQSESTEQQAQADPAVQAVQPAQPRQATQTVQQATAKLEQTLEQASEQVATE